MSSWEEFRDRCQSHVALVRRTRDEGVFAKLYANDVQLLLDMIQCATETYPEGIVPETVFTQLSGDAPRRAKAWDPP